MPLPKNIEGESPRDRTLRKIWTTKGARLEAYRRLTRAGVASKWVVTLTSLGLIAGTVVDGSVEPWTLGTPWQVWALVGAICILVVSALEYGKSYELRADRQHRAARKLNELYDRATIAPTLSDEELNDEYHQTLEQFDENHEPIDYHMFALRHPDDFTTSLWEEFHIRIIWHLRGQWAWALGGMVVVIFWMMI